MIAADFHAQNSGNNDTSKNAAESDAHCANVMLIVQVCFLRLALPTSGLARRRRRRGAQLDRVFALYASRHRHRAWPGGGGGGAAYETGRPGGSGTGGALTAAAGSPPLPDYCWTYMRLVLYLYTFGLRMCPDSTTPSYLAVSVGLAGGILGSGTSAAVSIIPFASC